MKKKSGGRASRMVSSALQQVKGLAVSMESIASSPALQTKRPTTSHPQRTGQRLQLRDLSDREEQRSKLLSPKAGLGEVRNQLPSSCVSGCVGEKSSGRAAG